MFVEGQVVQGTFSILAPKGLEESKGGDRLDYPIAVLSQGDGKLVFRADLKTGTGIQAYAFTAMSVPQPDGTIRVTVAPGGTTSDATTSGTTLVLRRIDG